MKTIIKKIRKNSKSKVHEEKKIEVRNLFLDDYLGLRDSMTEAYKNWHGSVWKKEHIKVLLDMFPEGQIVVLFNDKVVGVALSIIVNYDAFGDEHTFQQITGDF